VRVIFTQNVADDTRALAVRLIRRHAELVHRVEDAAVHRLEAVAHIRQRAGDDDRHRIRNERFLHLVLKVNRADALQVGRIAGEIILKIQLIFPFLRNVWGNVGVLPQTLWAIKLKPNISSNTYQTNI